MDMYELTHWHQQRIQSTAVVETDSSKHSVYMCEDSTDEQNSYSVQQWQYLMHHFTTSFDCEHLAQHKM